MKVHVVYEGRWWYTSCLGGGGRGRARVWGEVRGGAHVWGVDVVVQVVSGERWWWVFTYLQEKS